MLKERTKAGLDAAREEGRVGGRRPKPTPQQQLEIRTMIFRGTKTAADAAAFQSPSGDRLTLVSEAVRQIAQKDLREIIQKVTPYLRSLHSFVFERVVAKINNPREGNQ
jgi:hypothetical protein